MEDAVDTTVRSGTWPDRFVWHQEARLFDAAGEVRRGDVTGPVFPDSPASLPAVFAVSAAGGAFRIGGPAGPPATYPVPMFETLTSGSTGAPRRILRAQKSWCASFSVNADLFGISPGRRIAVLGVLVQSLTLYGATEGLCLGAEVHMLSSLSAAAQMRELVAREVHVLYASPTQLRLLVEARAGLSCPSMRHIVIGGGPLDPVTRARLAASFPDSRLHVFYGAAETSFVTLGAADDGSVGRPYPGVEIALRHCDPEGVGEVWVRSPYLFAGYAGEESGHAERDGDWLTVGEMGRLDADGGLHLAGRRGRIVSIADQNVFPEGIEAFLLTLPGVRNAAIIPREDASRGWVLDAVIEGEATAEAIRAACRERFGALRTPRRVVHRDDWPWLASGKVDLAALAAGLK